MIEVLEKISVHADIKKTFEIAEEYPLFVSEYQKKEIICRNEKSSRVRITNIFLVIPLSWEGESVKEKNHKINWIQTRGLLKGLSAEWLFFSREKNLTEVIIKGVYKGIGVRRYFVQFIAPLLISKTTRKILHALKKAAEESNWNISLR